MQAKDIPDADVLGLVAETQGEVGACWWAMHELGAPDKVVLAKMRGLLKRGLVTGCACGCRGGFKITTEGRELIGRTSHAPV